MSCCLIEVNSSCKKDLFELDLRFSRICASCQHGDSQFNHETNLLRSVSKPRSNVPMHAPFAPFARWLTIEKIRFNIRSIVSVERNASNTAGRRMLEATET